MARGSTVAIYTSMGANVAIAATKFAAAWFSGSSAMVAEGVHSLIDVADAGLLLVGRRRSRRPADAGHPLGHGKELYFWALLVAILVFSVGGGMSVYEGILHIMNPEPITDPTWNYVVLGAAAVFVVGSFLVAFREFRKEIGGRGFWRTVHTSKDPTLFTMVLEDVADMAGLVIAFLGVFLGHVLRNPYIDGAASIGVGLVLSGVAIVLVSESKGLLIGEGAGPELIRKIGQLAAADPSVVAVRRPVTMYFGPNEVLLAMDVQFERDLTAPEVVAAVDRLESGIRRLEPDIKHIYIEAEGLCRAGKEAPRTAGPFIIEGRPEAGAP